MKKLNSGAVTSPANQGDTSGPRGESNGQKPSSSGRSYDDAVEADGRAQQKNKINLRSCRRIGTWNVRSMTDPSKIHILEKEMERCNIPICGLSEVRWTGKGHFSLEDRHTIYYSGPDKLRRNGVGFILSREAARCVLGYNPISDRMISIRLQAKPVNISIVQVYSPTSTADDEEIDSFYHELQETINKIPSKDITIIIGDFNAKVGNDLESNNAIGKFGLGKANERGERLVDFCNDNELTVTNTLFQQHPRRLYTWISPDGKTRNQIDYILIRRRWRSSVKVTRTYPGADCGSDHQLLVAEIRIKLKSMKRKAPPRRYDVRQINDQYRLEVTNSFQVLLEKEEEWTPNELWEQTKEAISKAAQKNLPKPKKSRSSWLSDEVGKLADERRLIKAKGLQSSRDKKQYKDLSRRIQRRTRQDKQAFLEKKCKEVESHSLSNHSKDLFKAVKEITGKKTPKLNVVKAEDGEILTEDNQIKQRWKQYCQGLYAGRDGLGGVSEPIQMQEDEPCILRSEVVKAIKKLRTGKAPGHDDIPAELIKETGEEGVCVMHKLCNLIWRDKNWPKDWTRSVFLPLPKKGDTRDCKNNRTISLISHASKILLYIIVERMKQYLSREIPPEQAGFVEGRGTRDQIANIRIIMEKAMEFNFPVYMCFIDYSKAFDTVQHQKLWTTLVSMGFPKHVIELLRTLYDHQESTVRTACGDTDWFNIEQGVRQGCILSPHLFNAYAEYIMRLALENNDSGISVGGRSINNLRYADDTTLLAGSAKELENLIERVRIESEKFGLFLNVSKTKVLIVNQCEDNTSIHAGNDAIEIIDHFNFLGSMISNQGGCSTEIKRRLAMARTSMSTMNKIWKDRSIIKTTKIRLVSTLIFPIATYACETWTINAADQRKIEAFEMWCWRKLLCIPWTAKRTNESVLLEIGVKNSLFNVAVKQKLQYFGHIARREGDNLEKLIMFGKVEGKRSRGRQKLRWTDGIATLTKRSIYSCYNKAQNRYEWRNFIKKVTNTQT